MTENTKDIHPSQVKSLEPKMRVAQIKGEEGLYEGGLPPITDIVLPTTTTKSALIRWLYRVGYEPKEIYVFLGIKYQMVRNIITTTPKRAAREDLPPLIIEYKEQGDVIDDALDGALDESLMAGRRERNRQRKEQLRYNPDLETDEEGEE